MSTATVADPADDSAVSARLEGVLAGRPSAATYAELETLRPRLLQMSSDDRARYAAAWERQLSATHAQLMVAQIAATTPDTGTPLPDVDQDILTSELAGLVRRSAQSVKADLHRARWVTAAGPVVFSLLSCGDATIQHLRAFDDVTATLTPEQAREVDTRVSHRAASLSVAAYRRLLRQAAAAVDPDPGPRHDRAKRQAGIRMCPAADGMATLEILLAATDAILAMDAINRAADASKRPGDTRNHGMRQVDALLDALLGNPAPEADRLPVRRRRRADVRVTVDLLTLLRLREAPAELDGYGPIPAELARALAAEGSVLRRLVTDPVTGTLVDYGRSRYVPDSFLRGLLEARDVTCRFPGCQRRAQACDTEHGRPYDDGGVTAGANCALMCRKHHNHKTHGGFRYDRTDPATGETIWTTPLGFRYRQAPASYCPTGTDTGDTTRITPRLRQPRARSSLPDDPPF